MATVRIPNSVAARKIRMAISPRLATRSFFMAAECNGNEGRTENAENAALEPSPFLERGPGEGRGLLLANPKETTLTPALSLRRARGFVTTLLATVLAIASPLRAADRLEFTRMVAHWTDYASTEYLQFIEDAKV